MLITLIIIFYERSCPSSDNNDKETKVQSLDSALGEEIRSY